jgi:hypothetical protein
MTPGEREILILAILGTVSSAFLLQDSSTPQGQAAEWILERDDFGVCPDAPKIIQRWALAVFYYSTNGDDWDSCFEDDATCVDAFLSPFDECEWFGITCVTTDEGLDCVERIIFEDNGLSGVIPTELGLLSELAVLGMEQGTTTGRIPSELGQLDNMIFIDLDFNDLTGSIPTEIYQLTKLQTLDLNVNSLTGSLDSDIGELTDLDFVQLQNNLFTGTIPTEVGELNNLETFNVHKNDFSGEIPDEVCDLRPNPLADLIADCKCPGKEGKENPQKVKCKCCSGCGCINE